jgi:phosphate-selective porin OprO/OprP
MELAGRLATTWWYDPTSGGRGYGHLGLATTFAFPDTHPPASGDQDTRARFRTRPEGRSTNRWLDTGFINGGKSYQILGLESVVNVGPLQFVGEYMNLWMQREAPAGSRGMGSDLYLHGGYFYLSYFLTGEHIPWNRDLGILGRIKPFEDFFHLRQCNGRTARGMGAWQVACRLSYADFNDDDIIGGVGRSATLALNWYWNAHTRLQLNYLFGRIDNRQAALANGGTTLASGGYQIAGARVMIDF